MRKGFAAIAAVAIVVVLAAIAGYFIVKAHRTPAALPLPSAVSSTASVVAITATTTALLTAGDVPDWKTYVSAQYGFQFKYPANWTDANRSVNTEDYFTKPPQIEVLDMELNYATGTLDQIVANDIAQNNCPGDHVIQKEASGILYVLNCSVTSESYQYVFQNKNFQTITLTYHDDFDESAPEAKKITTFEQIIDSIIMAW